MADRNRESRRQHAPEFIHCGEETADAAIQNDESDQKGRRAEAHQNYGGKCKELHDVREIPRDLREKQKDRANSDKIHGIFKHFHYFEFILCFFLFARPISPISAFPPSRIFRYFSRSPELQDPLAEPRVILPILSEFVVELVVWAVCICLDFARRDSSC